MVCVFNSGQWQPEVESDGVGTSVRPAAGQFDITAGPVAAVLPVRRHGSAGTGYESRAVGPTHGCTNVADYRLPACAAAVSNISVDVRCGF